MNQTILVTGATGNLGREVVRTLGECGTTVKAGTRDASKIPPGENLRVRVAGVNDVGDPIQFVSLIKMGDEPNGEERLTAAGITLAERDGKMFIDDVAFGSPAAEAGLDWDQEVLQVLRPNEQPTKYLMYLPALLILGLEVLMQRRRNAVAQSVAA